jgi:3-methylcrotonyl-CoA carboxylase alpha subunit
MPEFRYQAGDDILTVRVERIGDQYHITVGDRQYTVEIGKETPGELAFSVDGLVRRAYVAEDGQRRYVAFDATVYTLARADTSRPKRAGGAGEDNPAAAMPGQVIKVLVAEGDTVTRGQPLILLEAMKMEIRVTAPRDGRVNKLRCRVGQIVERGQVLLELSVL